MNRSFFWGALGLAALALAAAGCGGSTASLGQEAVPVNFVILAGEQMAPLATEPVAISGTVFDDLNGDGIMGTAEPGLAGVTVTLDGAVATSTDAVGHYAFATTVLGSHQVVETNPPGYYSTTPDLVLVDLGTGGATVDFGDTSQAPTVYTIGGIVFHDLDGDGIMGTAEPGLAGVTVTLDGAVATSTDATGAYAFATTALGSHQVVETDPAGFVSTTPNEVVVELAAEGATVNFGDRLVIVVPVDVKPGSSVNPFNLRSKGVLPTAILGSASLDVTLIDPSTILFLGVGPLRWSYEDLDLFEDDGDEETFDGPAADGFMDLALKFDSEDIAAAILAAWPDVQRGDVLTLPLSGALLDGTPIAGEEYLLIVQLPK